MQASSVKIGSKIMMVMGVYTLVISLLWIFLTELMFVSDIKAFTGHTWSDFLVSSPKFAELYMITKRLLGITLFLISLLIVFITQKSYSRGERWSWYALLIAGIVTWGGLITYRAVIGYLVSRSLVTFIIGLALFLIGIILPAKAILGKKSA